MFERNRIANASNRFQNFEEFKRTLCLCSAGLLRAPTLAFVLSQEPFNRNTRAAGVANEFALVPIDLPLLVWSDEVVCVDPDVRDQLLWRMEKWGETPENHNIITLDVPDVFSFRDPELIEHLRNQSLEALT